MKVKIGNYKSWWGPYQIANLLRRVGVSEDKCDKLGDWLANTWFRKFCEWVYSFRKRKIKVKIHYYDTWNMDHTLSLIILPLLQRYKDHHSGSPYVYNEDAPEELRHKEPWEGLGATDEHWHDRWNYVLDELIWTFDKQVKDDILTVNEHKRVDNGLRLFGKYFRGLWD